jgi:hypothetical protein
MRLIEENVTISQSGAPFNGEVLAARGEADKLKC